MTRRACRICGCTEDHACLTPDGPCYWIIDGNLCSACVIELTPEQQGRGKYGLIVEKSCWNCAHRVEDKTLESCGYKNYFACDKDRLEGGYAESGFRRPNKTVAKAQKYCPFWEVSPRLLKPTSPGETPK